MAKPYSPKSSDEAHIENLRTICMDSLKNYKFFEFWQNLANLMWLSTLSLILGGNDAGLFLGLIQLCFVLPFSIVWLILAPFIDVLDQCKNAIQNFDQHPLGSIVNLIIIVAAGIGGCIAGNLLFPLIGGPIAAKLGLIVAEIVQYTLKGFMVGLASCLIGKITCATTDVMQRKMVVWENAESAHNAELTDYIDTQYEASHSATILAMQTDRWIGFDYDNPNPHSVARKLGLYSDLLPAVKLAPRDATLTPQEKVKLWGKFWVQPPTSPASLWERYGWEQLTSPSAPTPSQSNPVSLQP